MLNLNFENLSSHLTPIYTLKIDIFENHFAVLRHLSAFKRRFDPQIGIYGAF